MPDNYATKEITLGPQRFKAGLVTSSGSIDAGRLVATDTTGKIDPSLLHTGGGGADFSLGSTAAANLSGQRAIKALGDGTVNYADCSVTADAGLCVGITTAAAISGADVSFQAEGLMTDGSWSWSPGMIYLSTTGQLTQTEPTSGFSQVLAVALSATTIMVSVEDPIVLA